MDAVHRIQSENFLLETTVYLGVWSEISNIQYSNIFIV